MSDLLIFGVQGSLECFCSYSLFLKQWLASAWSVCCCRLEVWRKQLTDSLDGPVVNDCHYISEVGWNSAMFDKACVVESQQPLS